MVLESETFLASWKAYWPSAAQIHGTLVPDCEERGTLEPHSPIFRISEEVANEAREHRRAH